MSLNVNLVGDYLGCGNTSSATAGTRTHELELLHNSLDPKGGLKTFILLYSATQSTAEMSLNLGLGRNIGGYTPCYGSNRRHS